MNKETTLCISIAEKPGEFGAQFHNAGYRMLGLNYVYLPRKVFPIELGAVVQSIRTLRIRGCSVSMPHKEGVMQYLDVIDSNAAQIGAVNTVVNQQGTLTGYNTDYDGAKKVLEGRVWGKSVLLVGAGGVAKAIGVAAKELGADITVTNRSPEQGKNLAVLLHAAFIPWEQKENVSGDVLINATSIGMGDKALAAPPSLIGNHKMIYDAVLGETPLLAEARAQGKQIIPGLVMCVHQAAAQFLLYTGRQAPEELVTRTIEEEERKWK